MNTANHMILWGLAVGMAGGSFFALAFVQGWIKKLWPFLLTFGVGVGLIAAAPWCVILNICQ